VFTFGSEWCSASLRNAVQLRRNPQIENQGFNDAKNRYGLEHICHHHANSILMVWLLLMMALVVERLYRIRYLHRGTQQLRSADQLCRLFWLSLSATSLNTG